MIDRTPGVWRALVHGRRTVAEIQGHTLFSEDEIEDALRRLEEAGTVVRDGDGWALARPT